MNPTFFKTQAEFRAWLRANHATARELWVSVHRRTSGKASITYPEAVDEALCFGWIDGVRKKINEQSYRVRFTPRKPNSIWSAVNTKRVTELVRLGRMHASGIRVFEGREQKQSLKYSYERKNARLDGELEKLFRANKKAWEFFQAQAPWYRRTASWWVISAKQEATRLRRLSILIDDSAQGCRIDMLNPKGKQAGA
jgi:uncharacterized protein YdeI (YjbR/CyaY-like superfamily)